MGLLRWTLKQACAQKHALLEHELPVDTRADYERHLRVMAAVYPAVDEALQADVTLLRQLPDLPSRSRVAALRRDLDELGCRSIAPPPRFPALDTFPRRLGAAYVFEGATLGGVVLRRRMERLDPALPRRYVSGYHDKTGERWTRFVGVLERALADEDQRHDCVDAAVDVFDLLIETARADEVRLAHG